MNKTLLIFSILLIFSLGACKKEETHQSLITNNPMSTDFDKKINEIIAPYAEKSSTASLSIGIFKNNQVHFYGYGETEKGNNTIPDSTTIYEIGSNSKTFTALLMMNFVQSNSLNINCPVNYLLPSSIPALEYNGKPILIKHLLNHSSGLPRLPEDFEIGIDPNNPYKHYDSTKVYNYLKTFKLTKEPGTFWEYSNLGMALAGLILERQTHKSYEQLLFEKISIPLGLEKTKITLNKTDSLNFAAGYDPDGNLMPYWDDLNAFKGAGAIRSNVKDMISYGKNILFSESSVLKTQIDSCLNITYNNGSKKQASGWVCQNYNGTEYFIHDGGTAGFNSYIVISKDKGIVLVLLFSNGTSDKRTEYISQLILEVLK
jgi:CubicO group peptidase (beta-lactamase class C family)